MQKLLTWRSALILGLGLVLGVALAFGYRAVTPLKYQLKAGWPPVVPAVGYQGEVYQSTVEIGLVGKGAILRDNKILQRQGEYYVTKLLSSPFFSWLNSRVIEEMPQYFHTDAEWQQIIQARYDYKSQTPTIQVKINSSDQDEALYLARAVPDSFRAYLQTEEQDILSEASQTAMKQMDVLRASIMDTQRAANGLKLKLDTASINFDPTYIAAQARASALQLEVNELAAELATYVAVGPETGGYAEVEGQMRAAADAFARGKRELDLLKAQSGTTDSEARARALEAKVNELAAKLATFASDDPAKGTKDDTPAQLKRATAALAQARQDLAGSTDQADARMAAVTDGEAKVRALNAKSNELAVQLATLAATEGANPQYDQTAAQMKNVMDALSQARKDLADLKAQTGSETPDSIVTERQATVTALEGKVNELAARLTTAVVEGPDKAKAEYNDTVAQMKRAMDALSQARKEAANSKPSAGQRGSDADVAEKEATVAALNRKVTALADKLATLVAEGPATSKYQTKLDQMDRAKNALAEARQEVATLTAQADASTWETNLAYAEANNRLKALNASMTKVYTTLAGYTDDPVQSQALARLVVGEPTTPESAPTDQMSGKKALMFGAVLGLGGAWLGLNFKSVLKQAGSLGASPSTAKQEENDDDEEV